MFLLAIAALGFAFYEVEKDRAADKDAAVKGAGASTQGCGCGGAVSNPSNGVSEDDVLFSVAGRVDPRLRVRR